MKSSRFWPVLLAPQVCLLLCPLKDILFLILNHYLQHLLTLTNHVYYHHLSSQNLGPCECGTQCISKFQCWQPLYYFGILVNNEDVEIWAGKWGRIHHDCFKGMYLSQKKAWKDGTSARSQAQGLLNAVSWGWHSHSCHAFTEAGVDCSMPPKDCSCQLSVMEQSADHRSIIQHAELFATGGLWVRSSCI